MNDLTPASAAALADTGVRKSYLGRLIGGFAAVATVLSLAAIFPIQGAHAAGTDPINVPDASFRACLITELGFTTGDEITEDDAASLTGNLNCNGMGIEDITGAEFLTGLTQLQFYDNDVTDVSPVQNLNNLTSLSFVKNEISNITPLQNLVTLTTLRLSENQISNISALSGMTLMEILNLDHNLISDLTPLLAWMS